jgi:hypothetical protein
MTDFENIQGNWAMEIWFGPSHYSINTLFPLLFASPKKKNHFTVFGFFSVVVALWNPKYAHGQWTRKQLLTNIVICK